MGLPSKACFCFLTLIISKVELPSNKMDMRSKEKENLVGECCNGVQMHITQLSSKVC